jgi:alpha-mannosidase
MKRQTCFLVCNAHLDPVWLWPWEDGMTETISTYRVAADFCERHPDFVFNHNESLLYEWVEEHDPELFARIQDLVRRGRWHIAGGAYLQYDPIGTSGESVIRQHLVGKGYFQEKFGVEPTTAYNFDSFGHPRGLIQILAGCGFDSYIFCRPNRTQCTLPVGAFRWRHASGVEVHARRSDDHYITQGTIRATMRDGDWPAYYREEGDFLFLWGIGNHGGGPSRDEYAQFAAMRKDFPDVDFIESTPEAFFQNTLKQHPAATLPVQEGDLQRVHEGCYTSMLRVKQAHRRMENLMAATERLAAMAWWQGRREYPAADLLDAWKDILFSEFHDILPGSGIPAVEADCLARLGHCEEILRRHKARAMISLLRDETLAERNRTPIFVFNPHSWAVTQEVEIEYCLDRQFTPDQAIRALSSDGQAVVAQFEKAEHNLVDRNWGEWRRKAVFTTTVPPLSYRRFDADYTVLPKDQIIPWRTPALPTRGALVIDVGTLRVTINRRTGLLDAVKVGGEILLQAGSARPLVFADKAHAWETIPEWTEPLAAFRLATPAEAARIRGSTRVGPPISIIEDGPVRTIVEAIFVHEGSYVVQRYMVHKDRPVIHVDQDIFWNQHDQMLKLELRHPAGLDTVQTERCYSIDDQTATAASGRTHDAQHFLRIGGVLGVIPYGTGGFSHRGGSLRLHLLRSPPYSGMDDVPADCDRAHDRYIVRQDQGRRTCRHTLVFGDLAATETAMARTAWEYNQPLIPFVYFPTKRMAATAGPAPFVAVDADNVLLVASKQAERGTDLVLRFWEVAGRETPYSFTVDGTRFLATIGAHRLQTFCLDRAGNLLAADLLERKAR